MVYAHLGRTTQKNGGLKNTTLPRGIATFAAASWPLSLVFGLLLLLLPSCLWALHMNVPESQGGARGQMPNNCDRLLRNRYVCWCRLLSKPCLWPVASVLNPFLCSPEPRRGQGARGPPGHWFIQKVLHPQANQPLLMRWASVHPAICMRS